MGAIEIDELCLDDLLQTTIEDCAVKVQTVGYSIHLEADRDIIPPKKGNREFLHRAIEIVLRNTIRYLPPGAPVEIRIERGAQTAQITIRDYGLGIPETVKNRIFDPFFRADASHNERTGGLGFGLAIARRALRVHHGDILPHQER